MDERVKAELLALGAAGAFMWGLVINQSISNKRYNDWYVKDKEIVSNDLINYPKFNLEYYSDTTDVMEMVDSLNIESNDLLPFNAYKVLRFIDENNYEKISICECNLNYHLNSDGDIDGYFYDICDMFNKELLLTTNVYSNPSTMELSNYSNDKINSVISIGNLLDLKRIVLSKGMNEEYVNSIINDDIKDKSLYISDVAKQYVLLINSFNRVNYCDETVKILN